MLRLTIRAYNYACPLVAYKFAHTFLDGVLHSSNSGKLLQ